MSFIGMKQEGRANYYIPNQRTEESELPPENVGEPSSTKPWVWVTIAFTCVILCAVSIVLIVCLHTRIKRYLV